MFGMNKIVLIICFAICLVSCYSPRYVYSPPTQNVPNLKEKNDVEVAAFYAGSLNMFSSNINYNRGMDLHAAYAVSDHFAVMVNENLRWERNGNSDFHPKDSSSLFYKRNFTEIAGGYYSRIGQNKKTIFQVFGGAAFGKSTISDNAVLSGIPVDKFHQSQVTKIFIQPAFIGNFTDNFSLSFSSRFTRVGFSNIQTDYTGEELRRYQLDSLSEFKIFFFEPALNITFGFPDVPVKFRFQSSFSTLIGTHYFWHRNSNVAIGVVYNFQPFKKIKIK